MSDGPGTALYWLSSLKMTVGVITEDGVIVEAPPIVRKFIGQGIGNLITWMNRQGGFRIRKTVIGVR